MTVTLDLPPDVEAWIQADAEKQSLKVDEYFVQLAATRMDNGASSKSSGLSSDAQRALAIYRTKLRPLLEPTHNGDYVAIHPDSGDYEVAEGPGHAFRAMDAKHPDEPIVVHKIGIANHACQS